MGAQVGECVGMKDAVAAVQVTGPDRWSLIGIGVGLPRMRRLCGFSHAVTDVVLTWLLSPLVVLRAHPVFCLLGKFVFAFSFIVLGYVPLTMFTGPRRFLSVA